MMNIKPVLSGLATLLPFRRTRQKKGEGTSSSRYCYSVWLRHLIVAFDHGMEPVPSAVAELGPGNSLGTGIAALLSGADSYYAFDVARSATMETNLAVLEELVELYRARAAVPGPEEFPETRPFLGSYSFPDRILPPDWMESRLTPERIREIEGALLDPGRASPSKKGINIIYRVPWNESGIENPESLDMIFSQAVLEYVPDIDRANRVFHDWLKPGGWMSHQIDFRCHGLAAEWNGHWAYSDFLWKLIKGRRSYVINRLPHSAHVLSQQKAGFKLVADLRTELPPGISKEELAPRFSRITADDLATSSAHLLSVKIK